MRHRTRLLGKRASWFALTCGAALVACGTDTGSPGGASGAATTGSGGATGAGASGGLGGSAAATGGTAPASGGTAGGGAGGVAGTGGVAGAGAGGSGAGGAAGAGASSDAGAHWATEPVATPPTYLGTLNNAPGCTQEYATVGFSPVDPAGARHPLFLYFVGTIFVAGDPSAVHTSEAARAVTQAMARRGFVALSVQYDNGAIAWLSDHQNQLACLFGAANARSLLAAACAHPRVDCDLGIATWGHSQGGLVADLAGNHDARIRAAWTTGYGGDPRAQLARNRFRVVNGEADTTNGTVATLNQVAGFTSAECPDDGRSACLRSDGSGWVVVRRADCQLGSADYCWFDRVSCADGKITLEPNWIDPASDKPFALEANADWVAITAQKP